MVALSSDHSDDIAFNVAIAAFSILTPVAVGVLWWRRRAEWRTGTYLVGLGGITAIYSLVNADAPLVYTIGVAFEPLATAVVFALVLGFPEGKLGRRIDRLVMALALTALAVRYLPWFVGAPQVHSAYPAYDCAPCPPNPLQMIALPESTLTLLTNLGLGLLALAAFAATVVFVRRLRESRGPRRRMMTSIALTSLLLVPVTGVYALGSALLAPTNEALVATALVLVAAWIVFPIGFVVPLLAEDVVAATTLNVLLGDLSQPRRRDRWRERLATALDDERLEVGFWDEQSARYLGSDGTELRRPPAGAAQIWLDVENEGQALAALVADRGISDSPEVASAAALATAAAVEADRIEATRRELLSRAATAAVAERSSMARSVQAGAQQRLAAMRVAVNMATEHERPTERDEFLAMAAREIDAAMAELREIVWAGSSAMISRRGLGASLRSVTREAPTSVRVLDRGLQRSHPQAELAVYYCCLEALQNAVKHAGRGASVTIRLSQGAQGGIAFSVADDGAGFKEANHRPGVGLENMRDRVTALGGWLTVASRPGRGTVVSGWVPGDPNPSRASSDR